MLDSEYKKIIESWEVPPPAEAWGFIDKAISKPIAWYSKPWAKAGIVATAVVATVLTMLYVSEPNVLHNNARTESAETTNTVEPSSEIKVKTESTDAKIQTETATENVNDKLEKSQTIRISDLSAVQKSVLESNKPVIAEGSSAATQTKATVNDNEQGSSSNNNLTYDALSLELSATTVCTGKMVTIRVKGARIGYMVDFGDKNRVTLAHVTTGLPYVYTQPGLYTVAIIHNDKVLMSKEIRVDDKVQAYFKTNTLENTTVAFANISLNADKYFWYFGDGKSETVTSNTSVSHLYNSSSKRIYKVKLIAMSTLTGCSDTFESEVKNPNFRNYFTTVIPNVFTPNNDGLNDVFEIPANELKEWHLIIVSETGKVVFETSKQQNYWNGKINNQGNDCGSGTYRYIIKYMQPDDDEMHQKSGYITLVRE